MYMYVDECMKISVSTERLASLPETMFCSSKNVLTIQSLSKFPIQSWQVSAIGVNLGSCAIQ